MIPKYVHEYVERAKLDDVKELFDLAKMRYGQIMQNMASEFRVGQTAHFESRRGVSVRGRITKINSKSVTLLAEDGRQWRVGPSLLVAD